MKRSKSILVLLFIIGISLVRCERYSGNNIYFLYDLQEDAYYDSEIFDVLNLNIYGKWKLSDVSGGIHGNGHDLNFDYLVILKYGIYGFIKDNRILEFGKIKVDEQTAENLLITFEPDRNSDLFMSDPEKLVNFSGLDNLDLNSPCCDRFNYHFKRIE